MTLLECRENVNANNPPYRLPADRTSKAEIDAQLAEIARRHAKRNGKPGVLSLRPRELSRLKRDRHGEAAIQDTRSGRDLLYARATYVLHLSNPRKRIVSLYQLDAPWMPRAEVEAIAERIVNSPPRRWTAPSLGEFLQLTDVERMRCRITTFRSIDGPSPKARKKMRDREYQAKRRRGKGAKQRAQYEADSMERREPWLALGMKRTKFFALGFNKLPRAADRSVVSASMRAAA